MKSAMVSIIAIYFAAALIVALVFVIVDIRNNLRHGRLGLLHTAARLPLIMLYWPVLISLLVYRVWHVSKIQRD